MATKRTTKKDIETEKPVEKTEQQKINEMINDSYNAGKEAGREEMAQKIEDALRNRAALLFLNKSDDIAKEVRDISTNLKTTLLES